LSGTRGELNATAKPELTWSKRSPAVIQDVECRLKHLCEVKRVISMSDRVARLNYLGECSKHRPAAAVQQLKGDVIGWWGKVGLLDGEIAKLRENH
jgi:hypothetical protein